MPAFGAPHPGRRTLARSAAVTEFELRPDRRSQEGDLDDEYQTLITPEGSGSSQPRGSSKSGRLTLRLLHRRHADIGLCGRTLSLTSPVDVCAAHAGLGVLYGRARGDDGHSNEAADGSISSSCASLPASRRLKLLRALHAKSSRGLRAAKALGLAGLIAAIDKFWGGGAVDDQKRAGLERFSSEALLISSAEVAPRQSLRSLVGPHRHLFLGFHLCRRRRPSSACGSAPPCFVSGTLCWADGRTDPPDQRRH